MKRRTPLVAAVSALAAVVLAACGSGESDSSATSEATESPSASGAAFTYTDARGEEISLDAVPTTVVAQSSVAAALWDAGYQVAGVYGELTPGADGKLSYQAGNLDTSKLTVLGLTWGEFDTEQYGLLSPDLLVDYTFDGSSLWYVPTEQADQILSLAPSLAVPGDYPTTTDAIETFVDLAGKLGADTGSSELAAAKADYEDALGKVTDAAKDNPLKVVVISADTTGIWIASATKLPELRTLADAGVQFIEPVGGAQDVFTQFSWEQISDYADADVILYDARSFDQAMAELGSIDVWANLPAVKAGQVYKWYAAAPYSYQAYTTIYDELADELGSAKVLD